MFELFDFYGVNEKKPSSVVIEEINSDQEEPPKENMISFSSENITTDKARHASLKVTSEALPNFTETESDKIDLGASTDSEGTNQLDLGGSSDSEETEPEKLDLNDLNISDGEGSIEQEVHTEPFSNSSDSYDLFIGHKLITNETQILNFADYYETKFNHVQYHHRDIRAIDRSFDYLNAIINLKGKYHPLKNINVSLINDLSYYNLVDVNEYTKPYIYLVNYRNYTFTKMVDIYINGSHFTLAFEALINCPQLSRFLHEDTITIDNPKIISDNFNDVLNLIRDGFLYYLDAKLVSSIQELDLQVRNHAYPISTIVDEKQFILKPYINIQNCSAETEIKFDNLATFNLTNSFTNKYLIGKSVSNIVITIDIPVNIPFNNAKPNYENLIKYLEIIVNGSRNRMDTKMINFAANLHFCPHPIYAKHETVIYRNNDIDITRIYISLQGLLRFYSLNMNAVNELVINLRLGSSMEVYYDTNIERKILDGLLHVNFCAATKPIMIPRCAHKEYRVTDNPNTIYYNTLSYHVTDPKLKHIYFTTKNNNWHKSRESGFIKLEIMEMDTGVGELNHHILKDIFDSQYQLTKLENFYLFSFNPSVDIPNISLLFHFEKSVESLIIYTISIV